MSLPVKVLIVEDSEDDAKLALRALRRGGFEPTHRRVQTAAEFETALAQERWDAVISDFKMPGFTGMDALRIFRSTGLDIPFILTSGTIGEDTAVQAMKAGASDYVMKASLTRLAPALERELKETQMRAAHRRDQKDLTDSQERYRLLFEASIDAVLLTAPDGRILTANPSACRMFDLTEEELRQGGRARLVDASDPRLAVALEERSRTGRFMGELTFVRKDGTKFPGDISTAVFKDKDGQSRTSMIIRDMTERKKAEQKFKDLLESAPDAMVIVNHDAEMVLVNAQAVKLFGWRREAMLGQKFDLLMPERFRRKHSENVSGFLVRPQARPMGAGLDLDRFGLRKDGSEFPVEISLSPLETSEGTLVITAIRDLTERKQAEQTLRTSEERFKTMFVQAPLGIALIDSLTGHIREVNPRFAEIAGRTVEEMANIDWIQITHPDDVQADLDNMALLNAGKINEFQMEKRYRHPDGTAVWIDMTIAPLNAKDKAHPRHLCMIQDITERKDAEKHLVQMEGRYRGLLEAAPDAMVVVNQGGEIVLLNLQAERQFGYRRDELVGQKVTNIIPEGFAERLVADGLRSATNALTQQIGMGIELTGRRKDGSDFPIEIMLSPLESAEGILVTAAIRDITERKEAEDKIRRLNRVYAMLSGINTLIVRTRDRQNLFDEACRITVELGEFRLAWIGLLDANGLDVTPVARAGIDEGYLDNILLTARENAPDSCALLARALQKKAPVVCNDIDTDPQMVRWREEALRRGYRSVVVFPLQFADKVSGVLLLYASEKGFFDTEEMKLLTELAGDISFAIDHIEKQEQLDYLAYYDVLTGLANRSLFLERVAQYMRIAASGGHKLTVFLIDLERFKNINDSLGRPAGDALLRQVADWLTRNAGDANLVARLGADHFAVVLPQVIQDSDVGRILAVMMAAFLEHAFHLNDAVFRINAKVGVALFPEDGVDAESLFKHAEAALKKAKASGERYLFYRQEMTEMVAGKLTLENQLRQALDKEEFVLHYQPKVNLASGKMTSAEALIRWNDPRTGLVPPGRFISILEETGLIYEVGRWALRQAIKDYLRWRNAGLPAVRIAVNVSALQLRNRGFIAEIEQAIGIDAQAPAGLELEITESLIMEDVKGTIASLHAIRDLGVSIAIDDFGTGFSSLAYLAKLPVDALKIDRSFVIDMTAAPEGLALVSTIISLAHSLKLKVVAEGVETEEQSHLLRLLSCDEMQGFLFSKPVPGEIFESRFLAPASGAADA